MTEPSGNDIRNTVLYMQNSKDKDKNHEKKKSESNQKKKLGKILGNSRDSQTKRHSIYLKVSIKTANLLIFALCTNFIAFLRYLGFMPAWVFMFVIFCNYLAMYLSFAFVSKQYRCLFSPFRNICYSACNELCFYCCCIDKISQDLQLQEIMSKPNPDSDSKKGNRLELPCNQTSNPNPGHSLTLHTKSSIDIEPTHKLSSNSLVSDMSYMSSSMRKYSVAEHDETKMQICSNVIVTQSQQRELEMEIRVVVDEVESV